jgi:2-dehydro-3-deoxyphosphooctonate aldolase (KDO 8-P synthase)
VPLGKMKDLLSTLVALDNVVKTGNVFLEKDFQ